MKKNSIFLCIGFALFIFSTVLAVHMQQKNNRMQSAAGIITDIQPVSNDAKAAYLSITFNTPDNQRIDFSPPKSFPQNQYRKDQIVSLNFPKDQPQNVSLGSISSQWLEILLFEAIAVIMIMFFGGQCIKTYLHNKQLQALKANGIAMQTTPVRVELIYRNKKGSARCCIVTCGKGIDGASYEFKTDPIEKEPAYLLSHYRHHTITVYLNKDNLQNYIVDMSFLNHPNLSNTQEVT